MKRLLMASVAAIGIAAPGVAHAGWEVCPSGAACRFTPDEPQRPGYGAPPPIAPVPAPVEDPGFGVSCFIGMPTRGDDDPARTVWVTWWDYPGQPRLHVSWEMWSGAFHNRGDQYRNFRIWKPTPSSVAWTGERIGNPGETIKGGLAFEHGGWRYGEAHYKFGQLVQPWRSWACSPTAPAME
jgi:hypothetical protein